MHIYAIIYCEKNYNSTLSFGKKLLTKMQHLQIQFLVTSEQMFMVADCLILPLLPFAFLAFSNSRSVYLALLFRETQFCRLVNMSAHFARHKIHTVIRIKVQVHEFSPVPNHLQISTCRQSSRGLKNIENVRPLSRVLKIYYKLSIMTAFNSRLLYLKMYQDS